MRVHFSRVSGNAKTGPIPVSTTESASCPPTCGLLDVCYAKGGRVRLHWGKVDSGERAISWEELCEEVARLPIRSLWRHNQAGDMPGKGGKLDAPKLRQLVRANRGRHGFTYTHKHNHPSHIREYRHANAAGFVVNLSADSMAQADRLMRHGLPVVALVPSDTPKAFKTPGGNRGIVCPAERYAISCSACGLCAKPRRDYIIGFLPIGNSKRKADAYARKG